MRSDWSSWTSWWESEKWIEEDHRDKSSGQFEEQRDRLREPSSRCWESSEQHAVRLRKSGRREVTVDVTHSVWPWIAEQAGFLQTRFEERQKDNQKMYKACHLLEGILWRRRRAGGPLGKWTCIWEDGVYLGIKASTGEVNMVNRNGQERSEQMIVAPKKNNEDDAKKDG